MSSARIEIPHPTNDTIVRVFCSSSDISCTHTLHYTDIRIATMVVCRSVDLQKYDTETIEPTPIGFVELHCSQIEYS